MKLHGAIDVAGLSDIGLQRKHNEDALDFDASAGIMVLADGMGGHQAGEVASEIAVLSILADLQFHFKKKFQFINRQKKETETQVIYKAVHRTNSLIYNISQTQPRFTGMGTTLLLSVFSKNKVFVGHVGDSRLYRLRNQQFDLLTEDHSIVQAQINCGWMTPEQAKISSSKNLVTRALGLGEEVELTLNSFEVEVDDLYLLCSDGLTDFVADHDVAFILNQPENLQTMAKNLIQLTLKQGGKDNISVILVRVKKLFVTKERQFFQQLLKKLQYFMKLF